MGAAVLPAILGTVVSLGGSMMQANAQQAAIDAQNEAQRRAMEQSKRVRMNEERRQDEMRKRQEALTAESREGQKVEAVKEELGETQAARAEAGQGFAADVAALQPGEVALPSRAAGPAVVGSTDVDAQNANLGEFLARAANQARAYNTAKSDIGAYDELFQNRGRRLGLTSEQLNFQNKLREGSLATMGVENDLVNDSFASSISPGWGVGLGSGLMKLGDTIGSPSGGYG
jgi:hypothetical protein